jgi:NAD(P)H-hydrate epimerase
MSLTRDEARRIDEWATRELGIPSIVLMENAGRNAAEVVRERFGVLGGGRIVIFCGPGNNGGDGFVVARHLAIAGLPLRVHLCAERTRLTGDAATNFRVVERMGIAVGDVRDDAAAIAAVAALTREDVVVDALLGTGFRGSVRAPMATLIVRLDQAQKEARPRAIVAIDLPSGLDCDTGAPSNATIRATLTVTFVAPKAGFTAPGARSYTGEVIVRDIGAPLADELWRRS